MVSGSAGCWSVVHRVSGPSSDQFLWGPGEAQDGVECLTEQEKAKKHPGRGLESEFSSQARTRTGH